jgi:hypothetical protein
MREFINSIKSFVGILNEMALDEEQHVPPTDYGYWIKPDGDFVPVGYQEHQYNLDRSIHSYNQAFEAGWVRVVAHRTELAIEARGDKLNARSLSAIRALARNPRFVTFMIEIQNSALYTTSKQFDTAESALAFIQSSRLTSRIPVAEDAVMEDELLEGVTVPPTDYGYWIKPTGEFIVVPHEAHQEILTRAALNPSRKGAAHYNDGYNAGWVRVCACYRAMNGGGSELTIAARGDLLTVRSVGALRALAMNPKFTEFVIDLKDDDPHAKILTDPKAAIAYIQSVRAAARSAAQAIDTPDPAA